MADELRHHGIKGQKWGVRRFQDENGRLTPAGQKRRSGSSNEDGLKERVRKMSDEELRNRINRLNLEQQYERLVKGPNKLSEANDKFSKYVNALKGASLLIGSVIAIQKGSSTIASWFKKK